MDGLLEPLREGIDHVKAGEDGEAAVAGVDGGDVVFLHQGGQMKVVLDTGILHGIEQCIVVADIDKELAALESWQGTQFLSRRRLLEDAFEGGLYK